MSQFRQVREKLTEQKQQPTKPPGWFKAWLQSLKEKKH